MPGSFALRQKFVADWSDDDIRLWADYVVWGSTDSDLAAYGYDSAETIVRQKHIYSFWTFADSDEPIAFSYDCNMDASSKACGHPTADVVVGQFVAAKHRRKGVATAIRSHVLYYFAMRVLRVCCFVNANNHKSRGVAIKCGMRPVALACSSCNQSHQVIFET